MMMYMPSIFGENLVDDFFDDFDHSFFSQPASGRQASALMKTAIRENENGYQLDVELPGYKKEDIKLELNDGYLNITAEKHQNKEEKDQNGRLIRQERYAGSMQRSFYVGDNLTEEDVKAKFENGILRLELPKKDAKQIPEKKTIAIE